MKKDSNTGTVFFILAMTWFILSTTADDGIRYVYMATGFIFICVGISMTPWKEAFNATSKQEQETVEKNEDDVDKETFDTSK